MFTLSARSKIAPCITDHLVAIFSHCKLCVVNILHKNCCLEMKSILLQINSDFSSTLCVEIPRAFKHTRKMQIPFLLQVSEQAKVFVYKIIKLIFQQFIVLFTKKKSQSNIEIFGSPAVLDFHAVAPLLRFFCIVNCEFHWQFFHSASAAAAIETALQDARKNVAKLSDLDRGQVIRWAKLSNTWRILNYWIFVMMLLYFYMQVLPPLLHLLLSAEEAKIVQCQKKTRWSR
jgi:hypothetical protein